MSAGKLNPPPTDGASRQLGSPDSLNALFNNRRRDHRSDSSTHVLSLCSLLSARPASQALQPAATSRERLISILQRAMYVLEEDDLPTLPPKGERSGQ